jgi:hypothetical protein
MVGNAGRGDEEIEESMASILAKVDDDDDHYIIVIDDPEAEYTPKYHISNKTGDTKRVAVVWDFFEDLCETHHANIKNHKNLKICLACRQKKK